MTSLNRIQSDHPTRIRRRAVSNNFFFSFLWVLPSVSQFRKSRGLQATPTTCSDVVNYDPHDSGFHSAATSFQGLDSMIESASLKSCKAKYFVRAVFAVSQSSLAVTCWPSWNFSLSNWLLFYMWGNFYMQQSCEQDTNWQSAKALSPREIIHPSK